MILTAYQPRLYPQLHWWNRGLQSDVFVILDDAQFKRSWWHNRAEIWMDRKKHRLTVPIDHSTLFKPIKDVKVMKNTWRRKHLKTLKQYYGREPHFDRYYELAKRAISFDTLGMINIYFIFGVIDDLGMDKETHVILSSDLNINSKATDRLVNLCKLYGADTYLCGEVAYNSYMELEKFAEAGIDVNVQRWECKYDRGDISIIDPLMRLGEETRKWIE